MPKDAHLDEQLRDLRRKSHQTQHKAERVIDRVFELNRVYTEILDAYREVDELVEREVISA